MILNWAVFHMWTSLFLIHFYSEEIALWSPNPKPAGLSGSPSLASPKLHLVAQLPTYLIQ